MRTIVRDVLCLAAAFLLIQVPTSGREERCWYIAPISSSNGDLSPSWLCVGTDVHTLPLRLRWHQQVEDSSDDGDYDPNLTV